MDQIFLDETYYVVEYFEYDKWESLVAEDSEVTSSTGRQLVIAIARAGMAYGVFLKKLVYGNEFP